MSNTQSFRIIRVSELSKTIGMSKATIYRLMNDGDFPPAIKLGANSVGWKLNEVSEWINSRERFGV